eukprot:gene2689-3111_t
MLGCNCSLPGCGTSRRQTYSGIAIFKIPQRKSQDFVDWKNQILDILKRYRVVDETGRKALKFGAVPKLNLPAKSCSKQSKAPERRHLNIVQNVETPQVHKISKYKSFKELETRVAKLKIHQKGWLINYCGNKISFKFFQKPYIIPQFEVIVDESLGFTSAVYGFLLPDDHKLYKMFRRSLQNVTILQLLDDFTNQKLCPGVDIESHESINHYVPCELKFDQSGDHLQQAKQYSRSKECHLLTRVEVDDKLASDISTIMDELCKTASGFKGALRYAVLSVDEVKIQENLVFDKHTGDLIGYADLGDSELNYSCFSDVKQLAPHALVYYVRGLASDLKFSVAYFATKGVTSYQIMTTFWEAVAVLELTCQLPVIATVSVGASSNRKFYRIHETMGGQDTGCCPQDNKYICSR